MKFSKLYLILILVSLLAPAVFPTPVFSQTTLDEALEEIQSLKTQNAQLRAAYQELEAERSRLDEELYQFMMDAGVVDFDKKHREERKAYEEKIKELEGQLQSMNKLIAEMGIVSSRDESGKADFAQLQKDMQALQQKKIKLEDELTKMGKQKKELTGLKMIKADKEKRPLYEKIVSVEERLRATEGAIVENDTKRKNYEQQIQTLKEETTALKDDKQSLTLQLRERESQVEKLKSDVSKVEESIPKKIDFATNAFKRDMKILQDAMVERDRMVVAREEELRTLKSQLRDLESSLNSQLSKVEALGVLEGKLKDTEKVAQQKIVQAKAPLEGQIDLLRSQIGSLVQSSESKEQQIGALEKNLRELTLEMEGHRAKSNEFDALSAQLRQAQSKSNDAVAAAQKPLTAEIERLKTMLKDTESIFAEKDRQIEGLLADAESVNQELVSVREAHNDLAGLKVKSEGEKYSALEEAKAIRAAIEKDRKKWEAELGDLKNQVKLKDQELSGLQKKLQQQSASVVDTERSRKLLEDDRAKLNQMIKDTEALLKNKDSQLEQALTELESANEALKSERKLSGTQSKTAEQLKKDIQKGEQLALEKEKELSTLRDEFKSLHQQLLAERDRAKDIPSLRKEVDTLTNTLKEQAAIVNGKDQRIIELIEKVESLEMEALKRDSQLASFDKIKAELETAKQDSNAALKAAETSAKEEIYRLQTRITNAEGSLSLKDQEIASVAAQVKQAKDQTALEEQRARGLEQEKQDLTQALQATQKELAAAKESMKDQTKAIADAVKSKGELVLEKEGEIASLNQKLGLEQKVVEDLQGEISRLRGIIQAQEVTAKEKETKIAELSAQLEQVLSQKSLADAETAKARAEMAEAAYAFKEQIDALKKTIDAQEEELDTASKNLRETYDKHGVETTALQNTTEKLSAELELARRERVGVDKEMLDLTKEMQALERSVNKTVSDAKQPLEGEIRKLKEQIEALQALIDEKDELVARVSEKSKNLQFELATEKQKIGALTDEKIILEEQVAVANGKLQTMETTLEKLEKLLNLPGASN